jgi:hypothetical protein
MGNAVDRARWCSNAAPNLADSHQIVSNPARPLAYVAVTCQTVACGKW